MVNITGIDASLKTSILGRGFDVPFFISPFASAGITNETSERGLVNAAAAHGALYIISYSRGYQSRVRLTRTYKNQVLWQQVSLSNLDDGLPRDMFKSIESTGMNAIVLTVDSAGDRTAYRPLRRLKDTSISRDPRYTLMTWDYYTELQSATSLPIIPKGIRTVEDAREAIEPRGRSLDGLPSALEVAWEIHQRDLSIFEEIKVYADGGVRYGTDVLKLLALGVLLAWGGLSSGISRAMSLLTNEITSAGANLGLASIKDINATYLELPTTACNS
ncbi:hypothetical protein FOPG_16972 [Fusarium oxysporum f. sp. conglutinans race 2 54008]|uniref:FMN hydroxy acid dehydrogenase domain-containing protein n=1 Tax=Fusarium oxysporum f. sp. conglutinans race 2 54008 TaxID=1089457 RepID=X0GU17_FUSOX|nr:hypothetical protein FOPG_16972 [Fusarium oxysporum f. sp. conglutinans race 2 54008]